MEEQYLAALPHISKIKHSPTHHLLLLNGYPLKLEDQQSVNAGIIL